MREAREEFGPIDWQAEWGIRAGILRSDIERCGLGRAAAREVHRLADRMERTGKQPTRADIDRLLLGIDPLDDDAQTPALATSEPSPPAYQGPAANETVPDPLEAIVLTLAHSGSPHRYCFTRAEQA
jgi:hypothetical protein